jgi:hypothetical protein
VEGKIYAVHDRDLKQFLMDLNLLEKITAGEIKCPECDCTITIENVGFISMSKGVVKICCDNIACFYKAKTETRKDEASRSQPDMMETGEDQLGASSSNSKKEETDAP